MKEKEKLLNWSISIITIPLISMIFRGKIAILFMVH